MTHLDDNELFDRFARKMSIIETQVADPPQWVDPHTRPALRIATTRFQPMFSATKFVVAGVIVALFGGVLLIAQPFEQQESAMPGAATDDAPMAVTRFTFGAEDDTGLLAPVYTTDQGLLLEEAIVQYGDIDATDARFSGEMIFSGNRLVVDDEDEFREDDVAVLTVMVANAGGRWIGTGTSILGQWTVVFEGVDGYEGLTAVWAGDHRSTPRSEGVIFSGDMPSKPADFCQLAQDDFSAVTSRAEDAGVGIGELKGFIRQVCPSVEIPE